MAKRARHWVKLWVDWLDSKAHAELSEGAFGLGPLLLLLAVWDGTYEGGGWLLNEAGKPMSLEALARLTHRTVQRLRSQLDELEWCLTLKRREDGALGFPNFGRWQETKSAKYMRTKRSQSGNCDPDSGPQTEDGRDDRRSASQNTPVVPTGDPTPNPLVAHVLAEMASAVRELKPTDRGPRDTPANRKLIAAVTKAHALTPELWSTAIRRQLANVRPNRANWTYLSLSTLCVPRNMARLLDAPDAGSASHGESTLPSVAEVRARDLVEDTRATR
jgi:hypothetical protein